MPELPEVEVVRRGLAAHVVGRRISQVEVLHPRVVRRHDRGSADFVGALTGLRLTGAARRGKFLWLGTDREGVALAAHLGMSGQFRVGPPQDPPGASRPGVHERAATSRPRHARARFGLPDEDLWFIDQRTFGWAAVRPLVLDPHDVAVPDLVLSVAPDPTEAHFDLGHVAEQMRRRRTEIKRLLLDQCLVSGIGNIYADEALWHAGVHPQRRADLLATRSVEDVLEAAVAVMAASLAAGGTSFDDLYVHVNGSSGYYARDLNVYGREGLPCPRCSADIVRQRFTNRSSHFCPACQPAPGATD